METPKRYIRYFVANFPDIEQSIYSFEFNLETCDELINILRLSLTSKITSSDMLDLFSRCSAYKHKGTLDYSSSTFLNIKITPTDYSSIVNITLGTHLNTYTILNFVDDVTGLPLGVDDRGFKNLVYYGLKFMMDKPTTMSTLKYIRLTSMAQHYSFDYPTLYQYYMDDIAKEFNKLIGEIEDENVL